MIRPLVSIASISTIWFKANLNAMTFCPENWVVPVTMLMRATIAREPAAQARRDMPTRCRGRCRGRHLSCRRPVEHVVADRGRGPKPCGPCRRLDDLRREIVRGAVRAIAQLATDRCGGKHQRIGELRVARGHGQQAQTVRIVAVPAAELP